MGTYNTLEEATTSLTSKQSETHTDSKCRSPFFARLVPMLINDPYRLLAQRDFPEASGFPRQASGKAASMFMVIPARWNENGAH